MGVSEDDWGRVWGPAPGGAPINNYMQQVQGKDVDHSWTTTHFDNSVNAVSFGFVATAILISMFLVMAIFEKFLIRTTTTTTTTGGRPDIESAQAQISRYGDRSFNNAAKLAPYPSHPKISVNAREVSVVMPGNNIPTFIAHPAPVPCPQERMQWPSHQQMPSNVQRST